MGTHSHAREGHGGEGVASLPWGQKQGAGPPSLPHSAAHLHLFFTFTSIFIRFLCVACHRCLIKSTTSYLVSGYLVGLENRSIEKCVKPVTSTSVSSPAQELSSALEREPQSTARARTGAGDNGSESRAVPGTGGAPSPGGLRGATECVGSAWGCRVPKGSVPPQLHLRFPSTPHP